MKANDSWFSSKPATGDGIVEFESAHMDDVASEIVVEAEHSKIHSQPRATLEVRRVLLEHLQSVQAQYRVAQRLAQLESERRSTEQSTTAANAQHRMDPSGRPADTADQLRNALLQPVGGNGLVPLQR